MSGKPRGLPPLDNAFNGLLLPRLEQLKTTRAALVETLRGRGLPIDQPFLWHVIKQGKPFPLEWVPRIAEALFWKKGSPEYVALEQAAKALSATRKRHGAEYTATLEQRIKVLEGRNRLLQAALTKLRRERSTT